MEKVAYVAKQKSVIINHQVTSFSNQTYTKRNKITTVNVVLNQKECVCVSEHVCVTAPDYIHDSAKNKQILCENQEEKQQKNTKSLMYDFFGAVFSLCNTVPDYLGMLWVFLPLFAATLYALYPSEMLSFSSLNIWIENYFWASEHNRANVSNNKFQI